MEPELDQFDQAGQSSQVNESDSNTSSPITSPKKGKALESPSSLPIRAPPSPTTSDAENAAWTREDVSDDGESIDEYYISSSKRSAEEEEDDHDDDDQVSRPFKRQKALLNPDYLDILNREIEDAAQRTQLDDESNIPSTQLGLAFWSAIEKKIFFDSVARMGKDNVEAISARIGTKSVIEVRHYQKIIEEEIDVRRRTDRRFNMEMADYPAAVELSQRCCHALDEAADALSLRQERREQQREEEKWGDLWDLTPMMAKEMKNGVEVASEKPSLPSAELFHLPNWLKLSRHVFMNSSIPGNNWTYIDDLPPSIWATTFEDFYSLAVSITRRLVQTAIFTSMSRIRAKQEYRSSIRNTISRKDVEAAVASLGLAPDTRDFWRQSARRLRLEVYDDLNDCQEMDDQNPMTYEEVEAALSEQPDAELATLKAATKPAQAVKIDDEERNREDSPYIDESDEEEAAINEEMKEVFNFSAIDFPETVRMKQALKIRVVTERQQEAHADQVDEFASYNEESEMWELLQKQPPPELRKKSEPGRSQRSNFDVESLFPPQDWRKNAGYCSEWETEHDAAGDE